MNIRYILPFIEAVESAFGHLFHLQPRALTPYLVRKEEILDWRIASGIGVTQK